MKTLNNATNIIVAREPIAEDPNSVRVLFSHADPVRISVADWVNFGLKIGIEVTGQLFQEMQERDRISVGERLATNYLTGRVRTSAQVRVYLARKEIESDVIDAVIDRLTQKHIIDDAQYAALYVDQKGARLGRRALSAKLRQFGIERSVIDEALSENLSAEVELEAIEQAAEKYIRRRGRPETSIDRAKMMQFLARKGFPNDVIQTVVGHMAAGNDS